MPQFIFVLLGLLILFVITWPVTVLLHELGHGIPALIFTRKKVTLYIGSYGKEKGSLPINLRWLKIYLSYNPFAWRKGLCSFQNDSLSISQQIAILLAGPSASLLISFVFCYAAFTYDVHGSLKVSLIALIVSSLIDLYINIVPDSTPVPLEDGRLTYNDGYLLKRLFRYRTFGGKYEKSVDLYNQQQYKLAADAVEQLIRSGFVEDYVYQLAIYIYIRLGDFEQAKSLDEHFSLLYEKGSDHYVTSGLVNMYCEQYQEAITDFSRALEIDPANQTAWNNRGYTYTLSEEYEKAIPDLDQAIKLDPAFAYPYNNRGLAKIKLEQPDEGLADIRTSLQLDNNNSYAFRNLGIYFFDESDYRQALINFEKAVELDPSTLYIQTYLDKTRQSLAATGQQAF